MNARFTDASLAAADLRAILALIADSTIVLEPVPRPEPIFSDWEKERRSADVDTLILAWIASHVPGTAARGTLH